MVGGIFRIVRIAKDNWVCWQKSKRWKDVQCATDGWNGKGVQMKAEIIFPLMMVIGAAGSLVTNIHKGGDWATSLQWFGAMLLYTALTFRNIG